jgi:hypothetical protein
MHQIIFDQVPLIDEFRGAYQAGNTIGITDIDDCVLLL